ncbi:transcriptional regulator GlcC [Caballeronia sp. LZ065]|uniref:transcriptional regulator GlcC n=1 Tax=Caballeronia sp. LZ065 TaxID=3038571 RepID=UPI002867877B|nr:transcriptional regulator GlcC [Caballeronia sp. LZ065]MDR5781822.1 transcriptional regulator GlcC [Caballeronia sp. LZ065]
MHSSHPEDASQIADVVAERIENLIVDGVLKPGQALPSERRLTVKLGASRSAVRKGLKVLRTRGIIETSHGRGSFVASLTSQPALTPMMHLLGSQPRTLYDIFEVRAMLEAESARLAALRGTQADFALITRRYEEMLAASESEIGESKRAQLDYNFHLAICEASHNPVLVHTLSSLTDLLLSSVFASVNNLYHRAAEKRVIDKQHARLYKTVLGKQPELARKAASTHIDTTTACLREIEAEEQRLVRATLRLKGWQ